MHVLYSLFCDCFIQQFSNFNSDIWLCMFFPSILEPTLVTSLPNSHSFHKQRTGFLYNSLWHNCSDGWPNGTMMDEKAGVRKPATVDGFLFHMIDAATCYKGRQLTVTFLYSNINPPLSSNNKLQYRPQIQMF